MAFDVTSTAVSGGPAPVDSDARQRVDNQNVSASGQESVVATGVSNNAPSRSTINIAEIFRRNGRAAQMSSACKACVDSLYANVKDGKSRGNYEQDFFINDSSVFGNALEFSMGNFSVIVVVEETIPEADSRVDNRGRLISEDKISNLDNIHHLPSTAVKTVFSNFNAAGMSRGTLLDVYLLTPTEYDRTDNLVYTVHSQLKSANKRGDINTVGNIFNRITLEISQNPAAYNKLYSSYAPNGVPPRADIKVVFSADGIGNGETIGAVGAYVNFSRLPETSNIGFTRFLSEIHITQVLSCIDSPALLTIFALLASEYIINTGVWKTPYKIYAADRPAAFPLGMLWFNGGAETELESLMKDQSFDIDSLLDRQILANPSVFLEYESGRFYQYGYRHLVLEGSKSPIIRDSILDSFGVDVAQLSPLIQDGYVFANGVIPATEKLVPSDARSDAKAGESALADMRYLSYLRAMNEIPNRFGQLEPLRSHDRFNIFRNAEICKSVLSNECSVKYLTFVMNLLSGSRKLLDELRQNYGLKWNYNNANYNGDTINMAHFADQGWAPNSNATNVGFNPGINGFFFNNFR